MDGLDQRLDEMLASKKWDDDLINEIMSLPAGDPRVEQVMTKLAELGLSQGPQQVLDHADYYRPGVEPYLLRWPLAPPTLAVIPMPFEALDHKTQFFVLFQEWTRRELDANVAAGSGDLSTADAVYHECLERAEQLDVSELKVRSYHGLATVATKLGDSETAAEWLAAAQHAAGDPQM